MTRSMRMRRLTMIGLLALAHERACETELAHALAATLAQGRLPDLAELQKRFLRAADALPTVAVTLASLAAYEELGTVRPGAAP